MAVLKSFSGGIESNYLHLAAVSVRDACFLKRPHSPEGHVVVLAVKDINILILFEVGGHDLVCFRFGEVTVELA